MSVLNQTMKIRKAKKADWKNIVSLCKEHEGTIVFPLPNYKKFYVAENKKQIIGCCALDKYSNKIAEIRSLVVLDEHRKKGIGKKLVTACCKRGKRIKEIFAITSSPDYFKKMDFDFVHNEKYILFKIKK